MSHDYLAGPEEDVVGDVPAVPEGRRALVAGEVDVNRDVLTLPAHLTIVEVGTLHSDMRPWLDAAGRIAIDGKAVEAIDGAGIQLLAAFIKDRVSRSGRVYWLNASDTLIAAANQMGLHSALLLDQSLEVN